MLSWWNDATSARFELGLAVGGLALLVWGYALGRAGRPEAHRRLRDALLGVLGVIAAGAYVNFGAFHFPNFVHGWDTFHYYIGGKYFRELGYERLYECTAIADVEAGLGYKVEQRKITDLRTNLLATTQEILANPERCTSHFSPERWEAFKRDIAFFRQRESSQRWEDTQTDHGYNGTPVWAIAGGFLASLAPAGERQIVLLDSIDLVYLLAMALLIWWGFGWRVACVALLVFATNFPSRFYWTGGSFLRQDWLFWMVATVVFLRKDRPFAAGCSLAYAVLLRIFPVLLLLGPALAALHALWRDPRPDRRLLRFLAGGAVAAVVLVSISLATQGGPRAYAGLVQNTVKHANTPLTNNMGLRTVVAYRPSEAGRLLRSGWAQDPWQEWKEARRRSFHQARVVYAALVIGFLALLAFAVRGAPLWIAAALGATAIAFCAELTSYYYAFLIVVALLHAAREETGIILLACTALTQFVAWSPLRGMPDWFDEQFTLMSAITLGAFVLLLWTFGRGGATSSYPSHSPAESAYRRPGP
jgi:hypothetical protein